MPWFARKKGQAITGELVVTIALVLIALAAMTTYVRRAVQARYRDADRLMYLKAAEVLDKGVVAQYEPYYTDTTSEVESRRRSEQATDMTGMVETSSRSEQSLSTFSKQKPF